MVKKKELNFKKGYPLIITRVMEYQLRKMRKFASATSNQELLDEVTSSNNKLDYVFEEIKKHLTEKEYFIFLNYTRYRFDFKVIAKELNLSVNRVREIYNKCLNKIKKIDKKDIDL